MPTNYKKIVKYPYLMLDQETMGYTKNQSFITSQPPLIVFTVCLAAFGFTMIVLAYVVGETEIPNPDVQMDWNRLFQKMSDLKLCPLQSAKYSNENFRSAKNVIPDSALNSTVHIVDNSKSMSAVLSNVVDSALLGSSPEPTFVDMSFKVKLNVKGNLPSRNHFHLKGKLKGKLLGFSDKYSQVLFNVSMSFHASGTNNSCNGDKCNYMFDVCICMKLPIDVLPKMKGPDVCTIEDVPIEEVLHVVFSEFQPMNSKDSTPTCLDLNYTPDATLTEMLSPQDRSIVNLHLMHTSYFMFVMVMTLIGYSLIRGRYRQPKSYQSLQKAPLDA
ncbi:hypothetical protein JTE90_019765 [Oedothorax gibbosus]|uniref:TMEM248/TMEM219 domain-containing protein n=1 Tax=Oedothorax gibbosus TaxID=931172 RepID=A0AAV6UPJ7_9ARAC|nr:hypothetical protein JTE90_019765 [Oedothorax gibbosus]